MSSSQIHLFPDEPLGPDHPNVASCLNNLAELLRETNRLAEAEPMYRRALAIDEASFGSDHPKVAIRLNNLALLLQATKRLAEAELSMRRAMEIDEKVFGPDHPNVAIGLINLAQLLQGSKRLTEAEPLVRKAIWILLAFSQKNGYEHPYMQAIFRCYADLLVTMGHSQADSIAEIRALIQAHRLRS